MAVVRIKSICLTMNLFFSALAYDDQQWWAVSGAAPLVSVHLRHARALQDPSNSSRVGWIVRRHAYRVRRGYREAAHTSPSPRIPKVTRRRVESELRSAQSGQRSRDQQRCGDYKWPGASQDRVHRECDARAGRGPAGGRGSTREGSRKSIFLCLMFIC